MHCIPLFLYIIIRFLNPAFQVRQCVCVTRQFHLAGKSFAFAKSDMVNDGCVVEVYDRTGEMKFSLDFKDSVNHVCVNGKYISVAHGDNVDILKRNGKVKKSFETTTTVKYAAPFSNGKSAIVFSGGNTSVMQ